MLYVGVTSTGPVLRGLPAAWALGDVRLAVARDAPPPTLLVRRGVRPGGLAPRESVTRFTWGRSPPRLHKERAWCLVTRREHHECDDFRWPTTGLTSVFDREDFKLVDGWWTFSEAMERGESAPRARKPCKHKQRADARTLQ